MITKHFFKILIIFTAMIVLGLIGALLVSNMDQKTRQPSTLDNTGSVAN